eukprot:SAG31_NODE_293_length_18292_cov_8.779586_4_plen_64_part_00
MSQRFHLGEAGGKQPAFPPPEHPALCRGSAVLAAGQRSAVAAAPAAAQRPAMARVVTASSGID